MTTLEKLLFWKAACGGSQLYERTITNNPAVFTTEVAKPLKGLSIPFTPVQSGSGNPSPSNIRPITGWTGVNINKNGQNVIPFPYYDSSVTFDDGFKYTVNSDGSVTASGTTTAVRYLNLIARANPFMLSAGDYAVKSTGNTDITLNVYNASGTSIISTSAGGTFKLEQDTEIYAYLLTASGATVDNETISPQIEKAITVPVSWQTEAGTVYGGELDALTGVLTVDRVCITDAGTEDNWSVGISSGYQRVVINKGKLPYAPKNNSTANLLVNYMKTSSAADEWDAFIGSTGNFLAYVDATTFPDKSSWLAYLAEHPIQICYELAEPQTVQLDPVTLSTLIGENVIWTDTNSDNTIVYLSKTQGGGLGGGFGGGFGSGSDEPDDPENPDDPIEPDNPEIPEEPVIDE